MDDFPGLLARDFGLKPQGKAAPMASSRANNFSTANSSFGLGSNNPSDFSKSSSLKSNHVFDDHDPDGFLFNDVFGGPPKYSSTSSVDSRAGNTFEYDSIFKDQSAKSKNSKANLMPSFDKPMYDDDIFEGLPGLKNSSVATSPPSSAKFDDVFSSISRSPPKQRRARESSPFDDLLGNLGKKENESRVKKEKDALVFDDLLSGFGRSSSSSGNRSTSESSGFQKPPSTSTKTASSMMEDPFVVLGSNSTPVDSSEVFTDPLEEVGKFSRSESARMNGSSASGGTFDDLDPLNSLGKSVPPVSTEVSKRGEDRSPLRSGSVSGTQTYHSKESINRSSSENSEDYSRNRTPIDNFQGSHDPLFNMPSVSTDSLKSVGRSTSPPSYMSASPNEINSQINSTSRSEEIFESSDDIWLTVSEIPLSTQPTSAPPPSRSPPPRPTQHSKSEPSTDARKKVNDFPSVSNSPQYSNSPRSGRAAARGLVASQIDELEDFAMGRTWNNANEYGEVPLAEDVESSIAAAAMKEAMDRAEAKFRHAKEVRERESLRAARSKEPVQLDTDESATLDAQERLDRERQQREKVEEEREQRRLEREREREREREEREREQRRLEKERERAREIEKEREKARQAVERATREARERAAAEARLKAERAAVDKANAAARERAERAAVQRAQAEARERAAAEAKERADKAAAEARERANAEAREREARERASVARAERAAVERAAAEARERAAAAARANQNQPKNENDLESFFSMGARPSSAPRPRANSSDPLFDVHSKGGPEVGRRTSVGTTSNMKKASSETNIVDDLTSIFGAAGSSAGEFQEVEGETEERRKARLERHQRTQERAAKALAEKNQRDLQAQREQAERHRIAETLDAEVKRWAAGKEGNLRALLATLQYVLWPECGWQPVSLTDLITGAAVKKHYRKATLCIHPDKVQQKGANLQQKYIAEKVFDLLKESWNKFNSEELF